MFLISSLLSLIVNITNVLRFKSLEYALKYVCKVLGIVLIAYKARP